MPTSIIASHWSLEDLLPNGVGHLEKFLDQIESCVQKIESYRQCLSNDFPIGDFHYLLHMIETLHELTGVVEGYAYLSYAEDTQNPSALSLRDRIDQVLAGIENRTMFFSLWFKSLTDENAEQYITAAGDFNYYLISLRRFKPYTLSEPEEKIINLKDVNGFEALVKIYEILTNGYTFNLEVDGEVKKLTRDGLTQYCYHPFAQKRTAAYQELYRVYGENKAVLDKST